MRPSAVFYENRSEVNDARVWWIVSDVDGVLNDVSGLLPGLTMEGWIRFCAYTRTAHARQNHGSLREAIPSLPLVSLCTGRPADFIRRPMAEMNDDGAFPIPCICESGSVILDAPNARSRVNPRVTEAARRDLIAAADVIDQEFPRERQAKEVMVTRNANDGETPEELAHKASRVLRKANFVVLDKDHPRIPMADLGERQCVYISFGGEALDMLPVVVEDQDGEPCLVGLTKGHAVREIAKRLAANWTSPTAPLTASDVLEHTVAIGDTMGDFPMLELVRLPACPANAATNIKKFCEEQHGYVATEVITLGVCEIIDRFSGARWSGLGWRD